MTNLHVFHYKTLPVRTITIENELWFVAKDAALVLGYKDPTNAVKQHCYGVRKYHPITDAMGRSQSVRLIDESDVYRLITASKLPSAQRFKQWIFEKILPSLRNGESSINSTIPFTIPKTYGEALMEAGKLALENETLQTKMIQHSRKVDFYDTVMKSDKTIDLGIAAKVLHYPHIGRNRLFAVLRRKGVLMDNNIPYQRYINAGYFRVYECFIPMGEDKTNNTIRPYFKTEVLHKGLALIKRLLDRDGQDHLGQDTND